MKYANHSVDEIPVGVENAITNADLRQRWNVAERTRQEIVQALRRDDNGDDYIIMSTPNKGAYFRTNDLVIIRGYIDECQQKIEAIRDDMRKARRIVAKNTAPASKSQLPTLVCKLKNFRLASGITQSDFVRFMRESCYEFDRMALSKAENGHIILSPPAILAAAKILGCTPSDIYPNLLTCVSGLTEGK